MGSALICITTSARSSALKAIVWEYLSFCVDSSTFDFLVSLDGPDAATNAFCREHGIPLLASEKREGVGLSKNRVLTSYPDYDFYFFIEDDVQLVEPDVFSAHIEVSEETQLHHMSLGLPPRFRSKRGELESSFGPVDGYEYGSGQFNFFTRRGIQTVGGFHPIFAEFCRFGHTEHSYRFVNSGLQPYPFCVLRSCLHGKLKWHDPISVTRHTIPTGDNHLAAPENSLIEERLAHYPVTVIAPYEPPFSLQLRRQTMPVNARLIRSKFIAESIMMSMLRTAKQTAVSLIRSLTK